MWKLPVLGVALETYAGGVFSTLSGRCSDSFRETVQDEIHEEGNSIISCLNSI
ncbi:hypothetical protein J6590_046198 [Homalodisca vitripennis]|nr:hypothetical protein J6590_046198 [Homalodisca vitripennis]